MSIHTMSKNLKEKYSFTFVVLHSIHTMSIILHLFFFSRIIEFRMTTLKIGSAKKEKEKEKEKENEIEAI